MSRLIRKPSEGKCNYQERIKEYFGFHLEGLSVYTKEGEVEIQIVYRDFKHIDTVRREMAEMMPEVEFTKIKRNFSPDAMAYALYCMEENNDANIKEPVIFVQMENGDLKRSSLREIACTALRPLELDDEEIRYQDWEKEMFTDEQLHYNASD